MSGTRPEEPSPDETWLPRTGARRRARSLRARGGGCARRARRRRSSRPTALPTSMPAGSATSASNSDSERRRRRCSKGWNWWSRARAYRPSRRSSPARASRGIPVWSEVELGYRLLPAGSRLIGVTGTNGKTTTTELLGAILRAAGRPVEVAGNVGRALTDAALVAADGLVDRLRALELPARGRPHARLRRRRPPQPRARPPRPARQLRRVPRREAPHLRAGAREGRPARLRDRRNRVLRRRPAARRAADPRPPQPGERRRRDRRGPRRRRARRRDRAGARARSPASRTGSSWCASCTAFAGSTTRRRRTPPPPAAASRPTTRRSASSSAARSRARTSAPSRATCRPTSARSTSSAPRATSSPPRLDAAGREYVRAGDIATAVARAAADAEPGDVVLLSPACASYDQFANFEERGDTFRRLVEELS